MIITLHLFCWGLGRKAGRAVGKWLLRTNVFFYILRPLLARAASVGIKAVSGCRCPPASSQLDFKAPTEFSRSKKSNLLFGPSLKSANSGTGGNTSRYWITRRACAENFLENVSKLGPLLKMLAAICRGEMKAWQELMREEDIWPGVTFKWVWCDVHPRCIEASPAEDEIICHNSLVVNDGFMTSLLVSHRQVVDENERKLKTTKIQAVACLMEIQRVFNGNTTFLFSYLGRK